MKSITIKKRTIKKRTIKKRTIKKRTSKINYTFKKKDFISGDGMLTTVWGPSMWHYMHIMSFNYPVKPTKENKIHYRNFIINLKNVLPCKYCRINLNNNFKLHPLKLSDMKNRERFSKYVYKLHELVNDLLGKKSGLSYCDVRERYEHFRARCTDEKPKLFKFNQTRKHGELEKGCTDPLHGEKSKCIIKIVPDSVKCKTLQIDKQCIKKIY